VLAVAILGSAWGLLGMLVDGYGLRKELGKTVETAPIRSLNGNSSETNGRRLVTLLRLSINILRIKLADIMLPGERNTSAKQVWVTLIRMIYYARGSENV
jgi:hypothetical protein